MRGGGKMINRIVLKLTSARFVIAILLTITFMYLAITNRLTTEFITIYTTITVFYFNKDTSSKKEE